MVFESSQSVKVRIGGDYLDGQISSRCNGSSYYVVVTPPSGVEFKYVVRASEIFPLEHDGMKAGDQVTIYGEDGVIEWFMPDEGKVRVSLNGGLPGIYDMDFVGENLKPQTKLPVKKFDVGDIVDMSHLLCGWSFGDRPGKVVEVKDNKIWVNWGTYTTPYNSEDIEHVPSHKRKNFVETVKIEKMIGIPPVEQKPLPDVNSVKFATKHGASILEWASRKALGQTNIWESRIPDIGDEWRIDHDPKWHENTEYRLREKKEFFVGYDSQNDNFKAGGFLKNQNLKITVEGDTITNVEILKGKIYD